MLQLDLAHLGNELRAHDWLRTEGRLLSAQGLLLSCTLPAAVGHQCQIVSPRGRAVLAEVIGFSKGTAYLVPYEQEEELGAGMLVRRQSHGLEVPVGDTLLGRVVDGLGRPIDGGPAPQDCALRAVRNAVPSPLGRAPIRRPFVTGQRAIDGLLTLGWGQRVGIFAGSGVGKSTLLGEIAKGSDAEVNVIALIGERGREVRPFLDDCLGSAGRKKSVVVVATCDQSPLMRVRAAQSALTMAEHFRERGAHVLFLLDSLTRLAMAQRELGLALGEPPSARGYTPSVFQLLAGLVERMGNTERGSITGILTILVDGGDMDEPVSDAVRALVDGHLVLDRKLAERGHYPAVNIAQSISRVAHEVTDAGHRAQAQKLRAALATFADAEDLIRIGAYTRGASPLVDRAIELQPALLTFLRQSMNERTPFTETRAAMEHVAAAWPF
jgi:flagellum-specific ATP synthase